MPGKKTTKIVIKGRKTAVVKKEIVSSKLKKAASEALTWKVQGKIVNLTGAVGLGLIIKLFDRNLGVEDKLLGSGQTDTQGAYTIEYSKKQLAGKGAGDLVFCIYFGEKLLKTSDVVFNAQPEEFRDFSVAYEKTPEFEELQAKLQTLIKPVIHLSTLPQQQIGFLSQKTGVEVPIVDRYFKSQQLAKGNQVLSVFYYALLSHNLAVDPVSVLQTDRKRIQSVLQNAAVKKLIPALSQQEFEQVMTEELPRLRAEQLLRPAGLGEKASLGDLLQTLPQVMDAERAFKIAAVVGEKGLQDSSLPEQLRQSGFAAETVRQIMGTFQLAKLTLYHPPLIKALQHLAKTETIGELLPLAELTPEQWEELVKTSGVPITAGMLPADYARHLENSIEVLHPTAVMAARLSSGHLLFQQPGFESVPHFFAQHPAFDIGKTNIPEFIKNSAQVATEEKAGLEKSLKKIQRVKKLTATWRETGVLLNSRLESALHVVQLGQERFSRHLADELGSSRADALYQQAASAHAVGLSLMTQLLPRFKTAAVPALRSHEFNPSYLKEYPSLQALFGALDYCACEHDQSVLSPSAYLADLLQMLDANQDGQSAVDPLLLRRPDIFEMELSIPNTQTELPLIDLALEILENAIALPMTFQLPRGEADQRLASGNLVPVITDCLQATVVEKLEAGLQVAPLNSAHLPAGEHWWLIKGQEQRWILSLRTREHKDGVSDFLTIRAIAYQTVGTSEDLQAWPRHQNPAAYIPLRSAEFPWSLPFDLPWETVRGFLDRVATSRQEILEKMDPVHRLNDNQIVHEVLGLSKHEALLITVDPSDSAERWARWGLGANLTDQDSASLFDASAGMLRSDLPMALLSRLSLLTQQSRSQYTEMLAILRTQYVNAGALPIQLESPEADACCPCNLLLSGADAGHFDRIHRFIRLWRKLGWGIEEVDLAFAVFLPGNAVSHVLESISHILRLQSLLALPIKTLLGWWGTSQRAFLYQATVPAGAARVPTLYEQLFQNPLIQNPPDPDFSLNAAQTEIAVPSHTLEGKKAVIAMVLGISGTECDALYSGLRLADHLNLHNLFLLYRTVGLYRALGLTVAEYFLLQTLAGEDPWSKTEVLLRVCEQARFISRSDFSVSELGYLLGDQVIPGLTIAVTADAVIQSVTEIQLALQNRLKSLEPLVKTLVQASPAPVVAKLLASEVDAVTADLARLAIGYQLGDDSSSITRKLILPTQGVNGTSIAWSSDNPAIITNNGEVIPPQWMLRDKPVFLLATLTKGNSVQTKSFGPLLVVTEPQNEAKALAFDQNRLAVGFALGDSEIQIIQNLELPVRGVKGSFITWSSSMPGVIGSDGVVTRPGAKHTAVSVVLTATLQKGAASDIKVIGPLTVLPVPETDAQAVARDKAWLAIGYAPQDTLRQITCDLHLPVRGANGAIITWHSTNPAVIKDDGTVIRPAVTASDASACLIATITKGSACEWKVFYASDFLMLPASDINRFTLLMLEPQWSQPLREFVIARLAQAMGLDSSSLRRLVVTESGGRALLQNPMTTTEDAIEALLKPSCVFGINQTPVDHNLQINAYQVYLRLYKIAVLLLRTRVKVSELAWIADQATAMATLDFNQLPVDGLKTTELKVMYAAWVKWIQLFQLRSLASGMNPLLDRYVQLLPAIPRTAAGVNPVSPLQPGRPKKPIFPIGRWENDYYNLLSRGLELPVESVQQAANQLGMEQFEDFQDPQKLAAWLELLLVMRKLGATLLQLQTVTAVTVSAQGAALARALVRSKVGADNWNKLVKPIADGLRIKQRDALMDFLIQREHLKHATDLYEYYLIDPQMSPRMLTSRLVQATNSIQLYVQRCLLNLESTPPYAIDRKRWEWMKNYRVWEANRKVFLYPENWLYPELRDNKSQAFSTLESGLAQGEAGDRLAQETVFALMEELIELSNIKILGMYSCYQAQEGGGMGLTLYMVGRSPNQPSHYYWRRRNFTGDRAVFWTGWERIELDLSDLHVMPFVLGNNFYIAWPTITRVSDAKQNPQWEVKLNWARHVRKGWEKKKTSKTSLKLTCIPGVEELARSLSFRLDTSQKDAVRFVVCGANEFNLVYNYIDPPVDDIVEASGSFPSRVYLQVYTQMKQADGTSLFDFPSRVPVIVEYYAWNPRTNADEQFSLYDLIRKIAWYPGCTTKTDDWGSLFLPSIEWQLQSAMYFRNAGYPYDILLTKKQCCLTKVVLRIQYPGKEEIVKEYRVSRLDENIKECWLKVFIPVERKVDSSVLDPERPLSLYQRGEFVIRANEDALQRDLSVLEWTEAAAPENTSFFGNGYRENLITSQLPALGFKDSQRQVQTLFYPQPGQRSLVTPCIKDEVSRFPIIWDNWCYERGDLKLLLMTWESQNTFRWDAVTMAAPFYTDLYTVAKESGISNLYMPDCVQALSDSKSVFEQTVSKYGNAVFDIWNSLLNRGIQFDLRYPMATYNWELLYHAPLFIAEFLTKQQRFEDAQRWLHCLFDPTKQVADSHAPAWEYWQFLPFRQDAPTPNVKQLFEMLANPGVISMDKTAFAYQIKLWERAPFLPHVVARTRPVAYQWRVMFAYLDNLFAWGDQLFRRFTRESINEAIQLYVLASRLLGPRPQCIPQPRIAPALSYGDLEGRWDEFSNAWLEILDTPLAENLQHAGELDNAIDQGQAQNLTSLGMLYFCIPRNDKLIGYWDSLEDRLFKLRNCMDIEGTIRELPLFAPPIDPELLVRAAAAGLDLGSVLADMEAPVMAYRFRVIWQKAFDFCNEVKAFGGALLSALEKKDMEAVSRMRSLYEIELLKSASLIKQKQLEEAAANLDVLGQNAAVVRTRFGQYQKLLGKSGVKLDSNGLPVLESSSSLQVAANAPGAEAGLGLVQHEVDQLASLELANGFMIAAGEMNTLAGILHIIPDFITGATIPAAAQTKIGGSHFGSATGAIASFLSMLAGNANHEASKKGMFAQYQRRQDEWVFQSKLALEELKQINKQIIAAEIRLAIATQDLANHEKQLAQAESLSDFMKEKFTNQELYSWMIGELSKVYFTCYQLAFDYAKRAERALQHELGIENIHYIQFGYWDSLNKGLLAGELLGLDLRRLDAAFLEHNQRELELIKHISLLQLAPDKLLELKQTGECTLILPEALFDLDYPGHYLRRIKSVSLTIPCVVGPFTNVNCTLSLGTNSLRVTSGLLNGKEYPRDPKNPAADTRFRDNRVQVQSIATSHAQNDSGVFELNFQDERYLPFEGAGAISQWQIRMPKETNALDFNTISDLILHVKYTARDGGEPFRKAAQEALVTRMSATPWKYLFNARTDFSGEWYRFLHPEASIQPFVFNLPSMRFPFLFREQRIQIYRIEVFLKLAAEVNAVGVKADLLPPQAGNPKPPLQSGSFNESGYPGIVKTQFTTAVLVEDTNAVWTLGLPDDFDLSAVKEMAVLCTYQVQP